GDKTVRSDYSGNPLVNTFNANQIKQDLKAQVQITQAFGQLASKAVGDYAASQLQQAAALRAQAAQTTDPSEQHALLDQAPSLESTWGKGGPGRVALHALFGGLTGDLQGALGAGISATFVPQISQQLAQLNLPQPLQQALVQALGASI